MDGSLARKDLVCGGLNKKSTTYKSLFFILGPEPVAPGEESVGVGRIEPLEVTQIHTEPDLNAKHKHQTSAVERCCCCCLCTTLRLWQHLMWPWWWRSQSWRSGWSFGRVAGSGSPRRPDASSSRSNWSRCVPDGTVQKGGGVKSWIQADDGMTVNSNQATGDEDCVELESSYHQVIHVAGAPVNVLIRSLCWEAGDICFLCNVLYNMYCFCLSVCLSFLAS